MPFLKLDISTVHLVSFHHPLYHHTNIYTNILDMSLPGSSSIIAAVHTTLLGLTVQGSILLDGCVVVVMIADKLTVGMYI